MLAKVDVKLIWTEYHAIVNNGAVYRYGGKPAYDKSPDEITGADCSGILAYLLHRGSHGLINLPEGSQDQRDVLEHSGNHQIVNYGDIAEADESRIFVHYIRPGYHGTGSIGHTFLTNKPHFHTKARSIEAHGPEGCQIGSRDWDY